MSVVEVRGASVALGGRPILRDVDLTVEPGEAVAVLGANGSGKSTLTRAVLGLTPLSAGSVSLFDTPLVRFRDWSRVGYVPQRSAATSGVPATVREVVASGRLARRTPFVPMRRADRDAIDAALETTGLADRAGQNVATLSGGQHQRVLIARTLATQPDLLVLDEPNAGVDLANQEHIARTIGGLVEAGATVIVVLHELGPFAPLLGRAVSLRDGRVTYDGPCDGVETDDHAHHHERTRLPWAPEVVAPLDARREGDL